MANKNYVDVSIAQVLEDCLDEMTLGSTNALVVPADVKKEEDAAPADEDEAMDADDIDALLDLLERRTAEESGGEESGEGEDADEDGVEDEDAINWRFPLKDEDEEEDEDEEDWGNFSAIGFHNRTVDLTRRGDFAGAVAVCIRGLKRFPTDIDLLADAICYSSRRGDKATAEHYYQRLVETIPRRRWNWRAFTFSFDYLLKDPVRNEESCRAIIADYKKYHPSEERAYCAESELEGALGNETRSREVLEEAVGTLKSASQCALRLAEMQLDTGCFQEAIQTVNYAVCSSAQLQPSIDVSCLLLVRTMAKDALLHQKAVATGDVLEEDVDALIKEYRYILQEFPRLRREYGDEVDCRISILKLLAMGL